MSKTREFRQAIRSKYAFPGGYPLYLVLDDGEALCIDCAKIEYKALSNSTKGNYNDGFTVKYVDVNYEDDDLICVGCHEEIEVAYPE